MREHTNIILRRLLTEAANDPYVRDYQDYINGRSSLRDAADALDKWLKTYGHHDSMKAHRVIKDTLERFTLPKGLGIDFTRDAQHYWRKDYMVDYQISPITKGTRTGAPGGDKLLEVQFLYYPNGKEEFQITRYGIDAVLGKDSYSTVKDALVKELDRAFPNKTLADPNYNFFDEARAAYNAKNKATQAITSVARATATKTIPTTTPAKVRHILRMMQARKTSNCPECTNLMFIGNTIYQVRRPKGTKPGSRGQFNWWVCDKCAYTPRP